MMNDKFPLVTRQELRQKIIGANGILYDYLIVKAEYAPSVLRII